MSKYRLRCFNSRFKFVTVLDYAAGLPGPLSTRTELGLLNGYYPSVASEILEGTCMSPDRGEIKSATLDETVFLCY